MQPTMPEQVTGEDLIEMANLDGCELTLPMMEWVVEKAKDPEACVPCDLSAITPWYRDILRKSGFDDLANEVDALALGEPTDNEVAELLDRVKETVDNEAVRSNLKLYDCMAQSFGEEESRED